MSRHSNVDANTCKTIATRVPTRAPTHEHEAKHGHATAPLARVPSCPRSARASATAAPAARARDAAASPVRRAASHAPRSRATSAPDAAVASAAAAAAATASPDGPPARAARSCVPQAEYTPVIWTTRNLQWCSKHSNNQTKYAKRNGPKPYS